MHQLWYQSRNVSGVVIAIAASTGGTSCNTKSDISSCIARVTVHYSHTTLITYHSPLFYLQTDYVV
jgi:hypothetical protein